MEFKKDVIELENFLKALGLSVEVEETYEYGESDFVFIVRYGNYVRIHKRRKRHLFKTQKDIKMLAKLIYIELHSDIADYRLSL